MSALNDPVLAQQILSFQAYPLVTHAIDYVAAAPDIALVDPRTKDYMMSVFLSYQGDFWLRHAASQTLTRENIAHDDNLTRNFQTAAIIISSQFDFTSGFKEKLYDDLGTALTKIPFHGEWNTAPLSKKIKYCCHLVQEFLDLYDPENIIHDNDEFPWKPHVTVDTKSCKHDTGTTAACSFNRGITFKRYLYVMDENNFEDEEQSEIVFQTCDSKKMVFDIDQSQEDLHFQHDHANPLQSMISYVGDHDETIATLGHEVCHFVLGRLKYVYEDHSPEKISSDFSYHAKDQELAMLLSFCIQQPEENYRLYQLNKEEQLAFGASPVITSMLKSRPA